MHIEHSVIKYPSGKIQASSWFLNGIPHREDGPAENLYYSNGQLWQQSWTINGKYHRVVFPSYITYKRNGVGEEFYWSNQNNNLTDQVIQYLKENGLRDPLNIPVDHQIIMKMRFW